MKKFRVSTAVSIFDRVYHEDVEVIEANSRQEAREIYKAARPELADKQWANMVAAFEMEEK